MNTKAAAERYGRQVLELVRAPGNDACADCGARAPRWASWSLGIFICVQCAGVHRKMGTHISKVKSLTLDTWTREQVERMRAVGNTASNAKWNPDPKRHRPPTNMEEGERHSELERFIVAKYRGQFCERLPPPVPSKDAGIGRLSPSSSSGTAPAASGRFARAPSSSAIESIARSRTAPIPSGSGASSSQAAAPPLPTRNQSLAVPSSSSAAATAPPARSSSALAMAVPPVRSSSSLQFATPASAVSAPGPPPISYAARSSVFDDLLSLQGPAPLQPASTGMAHAAGNPWSGMSMQAMQQQQQMQQMQQQQQQQQAQMQQLQMQQTGMGGMASPVGLGQHAFFAQQAPQQQAQMLGASAFGSLSPASPYAPQQATSPFFAPQQQQGMMSPGHMLGQQAFGNAQQDYNFPQQQQANGISQANGAAGYTSGFGQQQQQQGQQQQPQFGAFANAMMPGTGQQPQQQQQQQWGQQQQAYGGGLWG